MKLSTRARYGLHCMVTVSRLSERGRPVSLEQVANRTGLSKRYLEQLAMALKKGGLLRGIAGRGGGYVLAKPADQIQLCEIVESTIGPISVVDCVLEPGVCEKARRCENRLIYMLINRSITDVLSRYSLSDLSNNERLASIVDELQVGYEPSGFGESSVAGDPCAPHPVVSETTELPG